MRRDLGYTSDDHMRHLENGVLLFKVLFFIHVGIAVAWLLVGLWKVAT